MIPDTVVKQIRDHLNIVEVIHSYLPLKRAGRHYKAVCPFHPEKTPSFMVNPTKQIFHCFGCGEGGDLIAFVMKYEHLDFPEAVRALGARAGIEVPSVRGPAGPKPSESAALLATVEFAAGFFQRLLQQPIGAEARAYLARRGVTPDTLQGFRLGFAPESWDTLLQAAQAAGITPEVLERAGLAVAREGGTGWYDRFRGRLIFPVWGPRGKVVGFGGRVLDESQPKYLNSPETEIYTKSRIVYGLHLAAPQIREQDSVAIVEGYLDLIIPYQLGIRHLVASMGTSLTPDQVQLLRRYTQRVIMVYDGDYAGELATLRGLDLLLAEGMSVRIVALPPGEDPDSAARRLGADGFRRLLAQAEDLFLYKLNVLRRRHDPATVEGKVAICEQLLPTIKRVPNATQASEYVRILAEGLKVSEEALRLEVRRVKLDGETPWRPAVLTVVARPTVPAEQLLLGLLLEDIRYLVRLQAEGVVEVLQEGPVREAVTALIRGAEAGEAALRRVTDELTHGPMASTVAQALMESERVEEKGRALDDCLRAIRRAAVDRRLAALQAQLQTAGPAQDQVLEEVNQLMKARAKTWQ